MPKDLISQYHKLSPLAPLTDGTSRQLKIVLAEVEAKIQALEDRIDKDQKLFYQFNAPRAPWPDGDSLKKHLADMKALEKTYRAELKSVEEKERVQQAAIEEKERVRRDAIQAEAKEKARERWMQTGGHPGDFDKEWPDIWREILKRQTVEAMTSAVTSGDRPENRAAIYEDF